MFYTDTDSLNIGEKYWDGLDKASLNGSDLCQGKNDYKSGGTFYGMFLAPKTSFCLNIIKYGVIDEHKTFKNSTSVKDFQTVLNILKW